LSVQQAAANLLAYWRYPMHNFLNLSLRLKLFLASASALMIGAGLLMLAN
jgi:hypothetical protein